MPQPEKCPSATTGVETLPFSDRLRGQRKGAKKRADLKQGGEFLVEKILPNGEKPKRMVDRLREAGQLQESILSGTRLNPIPDAHQS